MADEQSKIAQEQLPIYNKATEAQLGSSDDQPTGTSEGRDTSTAIETPQPPASNPGADDATAGISEGAGGLSSTAHIESPVPNNEQSGLLSTVKNMFGFGAATEEIKAEDKGPAEDATTAPASSILAGSAIAGSVVAATASDTTSSGPTTGSTSSGPNTTSSEPTTSTTTTDSTAGAGKGTYLDYQNATSSDSPAFPSSQTLPIRSTPGGSLASENTSTAKTDTTSKTTESTDRSTSKTDNDNSNDNDKMTESNYKESEGRSEPKDPKAPEPAEGKPSGKKGMENKDAIPTAGGKKLGEEHWGQSDIVPDDPKPKSSEGGVASADASDEVKDNTAKNTGGASGGPQKSTGEKSEEKEKFVDKIKDKLHIGKK